MSIGAGAPVGGVGATGYVDPTTLVPLFGPGGGDPRTPIRGYLQAWDSTTAANTVDVLGQYRYNVPVLASAEATLVAGTAVLLLPVASGYVILGRIRIPT